MEPILPGGGGQAALQGQTASDALGRHCVGGSRRGDRRHAPGSGFTRRRCTAAAQPRRAGEDIFLVPRAVSLL